MSCQRHQSLFGSQLAKDAMEYIQLRLKCLSDSGSNTGYENLLQFQAKLDLFFSKSLDDALALLPVADPTCQSPTRGTPVSTDLSPVAPVAVVDTPDQPTPEVPVQSE